MNVEMTKNSWAAELYKDMLGSASKLLQEIPAQRSTPKANRGQQTEKPCGVVPTSEIMAGRW